jgi:hypothetical protein
MIMVLDSGVRFILELLNHRLAIARDMPEFRLSDIRFDFRLRWRHTVGYSAADRHRANAPALRGASPAYRSGGRDAFFAQPQLDTPEGPHA